MACRAGLFYQLDNALRVRLEILVIGDFRDDVVVVGIEPLGHLQRRGVLVAAGQGELIIQGFAGYGAYGQCGLEHLVVVGDVGRNGVVLVQAQVAQTVIGVQAQGMCGGLEGFRIDAAGPVGFQRALEFAVSADARVALNRRLGEISVRHCLLRFEITGLV